MNINDEIRKAVESLGLPAFFIERGNNPVPCVVFNYIGGGHSFSDNKEDSMKYDVLINVICAKEVTKTATLVREALLNKKFTKGIIQKSIKQGDYFNTAIKFEKIIFREEQ